MTAWSPRQTSEGCSLDLFPLPGPTDELHFPVPVPLGGATGLALANGLGVEMIYGSRQRGLHRALYL